MAAKAPLDVIIGAGNIGDRSIDKTVRYDTPQEVNAYLNAFYDRGYKHIDTARAYSTGAPGTSEPRLGAVEAGKRFTIDSKALSREPGSHTKEKIANEVEASLKALKVDQINIYYLHQPDRETPFEETSSEVEQIVEICERREFVKPSVYEGQYNPIVRGGEKTLFPLLRKNNIAFYAWSPAGGGFFAGNHKNGKSGGRFDTSTFLGGVYAQLYLKPSIEVATDNALAIAAKHGISGHAVALRWTVNHSVLDRKHGDAIIIGASNLDQLNSNLDVIEQGPLPDDVVKAINAIHTALGSDEVPYHF
ncbi:aldo/keto reductase family domain-containing protein [Trichoderma breve]|uniref:Aldo/keto reductase family domain-containing protein n=1 Tax=Trichoderma breve TaxID=2034170 RepID=A0A9W9BF51_9HYPO|nr:aldo/keto reductase family domain-containing protein [Trichoderma breve]KAJ4861224.1 aldo/keto reductase family domain-containing protein [Trichoderma breve]